MHFVRMNAAARVGVCESHRTIARYILLRQRISLGHSNGMDKKVPNFCARPCAGDPSAGDGWGRYGAPKGTILELFLKSLCHACH